jgi:hypothetical protein
MAAVLGRVEVTAPRVCHAGGRGFESRPLDIILQRRILVALLPALEKSPAETKNIGKLTLVMIRNAAAAGLGSRAMGTLRGVIYSRPSSAPKPMPVVTDEYTVVAIEGYELVMTQARFLGIAGASVCGCAGGHSVGARYC